MVGGTRKGKGLLSLDAGGRVVFFGSVAAQLGGYRSSAAYIGGVQRGATLACREVALPPLVYRSGHYHQLGGLL